MKTSPDDIKKTLVDLDRIVADTRRAIVALHTADHLILWGLIWMIGFGVGQFTGGSIPWVWLPLAAVGMVGSGWIGWRKARAVSSPLLLRILCFFLVLIGYAMVWAVLLHPFNHHNFSVYIASVFLFAYVVGGLWLGRIFVGMGLLITALAVFGVLFVPDWRDGLMAVLGGGALIGTGVYIRRAWTVRE